MQTEPAQVERRGYERNEKIQGENIKVQVSRRGKGGGERRVKTEREGGRKEKEG